MSNEEIGSTRGPQTLSALDLDMAPDTPGIYAWYAKSSLSDNDWKPDVRDGVDVAGSYLTRAVADYARVHHPSPVDLKGEGTYRLHWSGRLRRASIADADTTTGRTAIDGKLGDLLETPTIRQLLVGLLGAATPIFASPLYIGVATNVRTRLASHKASYEAARARLRQDPSARERLQLEGATFGERLAATDLQLEHLQCWILEADLAIPGTSGQDPALARQVAETAEWILQRTFLPVLGRQ